MRGGHYVPTGRIGLKLEMILPLFFEHYVDVSTPSPTGLTGDW
jgi:hypothetical protein